MKKLVNLYGIHKCTPIWAVFKNDGIIFAFWLEGRNMLQMTFEAHLFFSENSWPVLLDAGNGKGQTASVTLGSSQIKPAQVLDGQTGIARPSFTMPYRAQPRVQTFIDRGYAN